MRVDAVRAESEAPRRILRVITRLNIGGPAIQALMLTKDLVPDYQTTLVAGMAPPEEGELGDPDVPVTRMPLVRQLSPRRDLASRVALRRLLQSSGTQLLHTHMAKAGSLGRLAARGLGNVKTVHTFHGHVLEGYFSAPVARLFIQMERRLAKSTDALIAVSPEVRDSLLDLGVGTPERFHVIPLGFDLDPFLRIQTRSGALRDGLPIAPGHRLIGIIGRLAPIKDHATLLRAMPFVPTTHLAVMGDGETREELKRLAVSLGVGDRVHFVGWRNDVAACISDLDVVVLTSRNEGTPVSLIEAGAAGRPVVSTDVGGVRSVVVDGGTGLLVPVESSEAIAAAINRLLEDPVLAQRFGRAGRAHVRDRFSKVRLLTDIRSLYADLLAGRPRLGTS